MSIVAADIVAYGSASMPDDDVDTNIGGAIDLTTRIVFTAIAATDEVEILSDNAGDTTQTVTVYGRNAAGELVSEVETLAGTTPQTTTTIFERILKIVLSATCTGTVTIRDEATDTTIVAIEPGVTEIRRPFYDAAAEASGGSARDYYEKVFFKNTHGTLTLTNSTIAEQADPSTKITFDLESTLGGSDTNGASNNRRTVGDLSGYTFDSATKNVANSQNLTAGAQQGCWLKLSLAAGDAANNTSWTGRVSGNTT